MRFGQSLIVLSVCSVLIPVQGARGQSKPYSFADVIDLVKGGVPDAAIVVKAKKNCITFHLTSDAAARLRTAGADDALVAGLVSACYKGPAEAVTPTTRAKPVAPRVIVIHDTVAGPSTSVTSPRTTIARGGISVPEGTNIYVSLEQEISSKTATQGDRVKVVVDSNVVVDGAIVISKGTNVRAEVAEVKRAGRMGKGGRLSLKMLGTTTVDGQEVAMRATKASAGGDNMTSTVVLTALFGPIGLLRHGEDIVYKEGAKFPVFTDAPLKVYAHAR